MSAPDYSIRAVQRVCDIIDLVQHHPEGLSLPEIAMASGLPKTSAFRYLCTLEERGYVERTETGDYIVGIALHSERLDILAQRAEPHLSQLRDEIGETANLGMFASGRIVYLKIVESRRQLRNSPHPGDRGPIHSTALGKVLVAWRPQDAVLELLVENGMPASTANTITTPEAYLVELAAVRSQGYAVDDCEDAPGGRCVAVAIRGSRLPLAMSVSAPASRLRPDDIPAVAAALRKAAEAFGAATEMVATDRATTDRPTTERTADRSL